MNAARDRTPAPSASALLRGALVERARSPRALAWRAAARAWLHPLETARRRACAARVVSELPQAPRLDPVDGYRVCAAGEVAGAVEFAARGRARLDALRARLPELEQRVRGNRRLTLELLWDDAHAADPSWLEFALARRTSVPATAYLGGVPYVARVALALSRALPDAREPQYHQRWHLDQDDARQVKLIVNATHVAREDGPLTFLPACATARVLARLGGRSAGYGALSDDDVRAHCDPAEIVELVGPPGSAAYLDLSRCLHMGSRVAPGRERLVLAAVYLRWQHPVRNAANSFPMPRRNLDAYERMLLHGPRRVAPGAFLPDPLAGDPNNAT